MKKTWEAMRGPTNEPTPLNDCEKLRRKEAVAGSPRTEMYGFAAVSSSDNPHAITKVAPTNPPKLKKCAAGQKHSAPTTYKHNPVMIPTLYPQCRIIGPPIKGGKTKYEPKYATWRPVDWSLLIPRTFWKCLFRTSRSPYAKPQRKNRVVTGTRPVQRSLLDMDAPTIDTAGTGAPPAIALVEGGLGGGVLR